MHAPLLLRPCSSFEAGRRGCELWALRHEQALRRKVAKKLQWVQDNVVLRGAVLTWDLIWLARWPPQPVGASRKRHALMCRISGLGVPSPLIISR